VTLHRREITHSATANAPKIKKAGNRIIHLHPARKSFKIDFLGIFQNLQNDNEKQHKPQTHVKGKSRGGRNPGHMDHQEKTRPIVIDPTPMC
jgi:hypothetical protein